jgi:hypothetical protein
MKAAQAMGEEVRWPKQYERAAPPRKVSR